MNLSGGKSLGLRGSQGHDLIRGQAGMHLIGGKRRDLSCFQNRQVLGCQAGELSGGKSGDLSGGKNDKVLGCQAGELIRGQSPDLGGSKGLSLGRGKSRELIRGQAGLHFMRWSLRQFGRCPIRQDPGFPSWRVDRWSWVLI